MTILSGQTIRREGIFKDHQPRTRHNGMTFGESFAGYDIRLDKAQGMTDTGFVVIPSGRFLLGSAMERFTMPNDVVGVAHDKSTWARRGIMLFNTVIEPGWEGYLTLEIRNVGPAVLTMQHGDPIAQVVFHYTDEQTSGYEGKYQDQPDHPVRAIVDDT